MYTFDYLKRKYSSYSNPKTKIAREVKNGRYIKINRNHYVEASNYSINHIGCNLIAPSYISFFYALYLYNMIEDTAYNITLATTSTKKRKMIKTSLGTFIYKDVPVKCFIDEVCVKKENGFDYLIATKEKALCDTIYAFYKNVKSIKEIEIILYEDMRLDERFLYQLSYQKLIYLSDLYASTSLKYFKKYIDKEFKNGKFVNQ